MNYSLPISPLYRKAIFEGVLLQIPISIMSLMILDFGRCAQICGIALLAFWGGIATLILRHPHSPTPLHLSTIRIGYIAVVPLASFLVHIIWRLRGIAL